MKTYAAYLNHEIRKKSSSGGLFSVIASKYEVVYGVAMTDDCHGAEFRRITGDISPLRGSKYFQASVGNTFQQVKQDLEDGRQVLFTGTGCQVNGLRMFLQKEYPNLLAVDVVCHGVPSPKLWRAYADFCEAQYGGKLEAVNFRCKDHGWRDFGMKKNQLFISKDEDPFMRMFLRDYCLRPACYQCHAKKMKLSDMTIADFWGIETVAPEMNDGMGTSLVITRTEKGQAVFDGIKPELEWKEVSYEEGVRSNPSEYRSPIRTEQRDGFFDDLTALPFPEMIKKYAPPRRVPQSVRIKRKIKNMIKRIVRRGKDSGNRTTNNDYGILFQFSNNICEL